MLCVFVVGFQSPPPPRLTHDPPLFPTPTDSGELRLRSFTTEPAISRVNPALAHRATHRYRAPAGTSHLAEAFVAACAPDAGARWDVAVRTFYPAVRDTVIARVSGAAGQRSAAGGGSFFLLLICLT